MEDRTEAQMAMAREASRLLDDPLFNGILNALTKEYINELLSIEPGTNEAISSHAAMRALNDIKARLLSMKNDGAMIKHRERRSGYT